MVIFLISWISTMYGISYILCCEKSVQGAMSVKMYGGFYLVFRFFIMMIFEEKNSEGRLHLYMNKFMFLYVIIEKFQ